MSDTSYGAQIALENEIVEILRLVKQGLTLEQIATETGTSIYRVRKLTNDAKIDMTSLSRFLTANEIDEIRGPGQYLEIGKITDDQVRNGVKVHPIVKYLRHRARVTSHEKSDKILKIEELRGQGLTYIEIGRILNCSPSYVGRTLNEQKNRDKIKEDLKSEILTDIMKKDKSVSFGEFRNLFGGINPPEVSEVTVDPKYFRMIDKYDTAINVEYYQDMKNVLMLILTTCNRDTIENMFVSSYQEAYDLFNPVDTPKMDAEKRRVRIQECAVSIFFNRIKSTMLKSLKDF